MAKTVMVSGDFSRIHEGHVDHIMKAYALGDWLFVVTHTDESIMQRKHYKPTPLWARKILLQGVIAVLGGKGQVVMAKDTDGLSIKTLESLRPSIYAKGGDRTSGNMPQEEIDMCKKLGCKIVYGIGDKLNSSRNLAKGIRND